MPLTNTVPFVGTVECADAYDRAKRTEPRWRAYFTNGDRWEFNSANPITAQNDARFWAEFTGRELLAVAAL